MTGFFDRPVALGKTTLHSASFLFNLPCSAFSWTFFGVDYIIHTGKPSLPSIFLVGLTTKWFEDSIEGIRENWAVAVGKTEDKHALEDEQALFVNARP